MNIREFMYNCPTSTRVTDNLDTLRFKDEIVIFEYINWQGKRGIRHVEPVDISEGVTEYHKECQWLFHAYDLDKKAMRSFAIKDIIKFIEE